MKYLLKTVESNIATIVLNRGKVNPINEEFTDEFLSLLEELKADPEVRAVVITGRDKFFSFGLDIPEFLSYAKPDFIRFVTKFAQLYSNLFVFPKPVIASLNGHTVAGGCMLASACDYRIMASGKSRISLNEINFGSSLFPGSAVMLKYCVGNRNAEIIAYTGAMFSAEEAKNLGLVDAIVTEDALLQSTLQAAGEFSRRYSPAFESIKMLLRTETLKEVQAQDEKYKNEMVDIWYSEATWQQLKNIKIHG
jgi:Delta3-Delta2-enoyl-CoA isomerase